MSFLDVVPYFYTSGKVTTVIYWEVSNNNYIKQNQIQF